MRRKRAVAAALVVAVALGAGTALGVSLAAGGSPTAWRGIGPGSVGHPDTMGGSHGAMMGGSHGGMMGGDTESEAPQSGPAPAPPPAGRQAVSLRIKSDSEHARRGPDGRWHDAYLPADFRVRAGVRVHLTVYNYDGAPHSFTSPALGVNAYIRGGSPSKPARSSFTFTAPSRAGDYEWWCALPCDPYSMARGGFMRGVVTVA